ncbi:MAG: tetratricopeptide repeat protein [Candidatus Thorarchaeota archaeon]|jgi:tetratricopeptide (TPR) repeat protein
MDISKRIVVTFVTVSLIPILFISALSAYTIFEVSNQNASDAADALKAEELANLERITGDTALFIEERMQSYVDGVYMMEKYCEDLFNERINATAQHSYYWDHQLELLESGLTVPGRQYEAAYEYVLDDGTVMSPGMISFDVSCYYMPRDQYPTPGDPFDLDPTTQYLLDVSSNMDNIYRALHESNPDYIWLYMAFDPGVSDSHLFRNYPYDTLQYFQLDEDGGTIPESEDYDPPELEWYQNPAALSNISTTIEITVDADPSTGIVVSMGRPVFFDNGTLIGVVAADVALDTILENVLNIQVLENGYAYLLQDNGGVIAHPSFADAAQTIYDIEFGSSSTQEALSFRDILIPALISESGQETFTKDNEEWYFTYATVQNTGFLLATVVPSAEAIAPATAILLAVQFQTLFLTAILAGLLTGVAALVAVVSYRRGRAVVEPISEMTRLVDKMATQDFTRSISASGAMYEEIGTTVDALLSFQEACRFGNQAFVRGDLNRALANYQNLLEISDRIGIEVGEQTMYLNIGNVFRQRGDTASARTYYAKALDIANDMLSKAKEDGADETDAMARVASVYHNMALVEMDRQKYDEALQHLEDAEAIDRVLGNNIGLSKRFDAMGLVMMKQDRWSQALSRFEEAKEIATAEGYDRSLAYVNYHIGEFHEAQEKWKKAEKAYNNAIKLGQNTEEFWLVVYAMNRLAHVLDQLDEPSHDIRRKAEKLRRSILYRKSVIFVIDYSGSMRAQDRIKAAVNGAKAILDSQVNPQDQVSIIVFNSTYRQILPLTTKGQYDSPEDSPIIRALDSLRYPNYATAFYDALGKAMEDLDQVQSSEHRWIIALTDGQDNSSEKYSLDALEKIFTEKDRQKKRRPLTIEGFIRDNHLDINLIVIGVGNELRSPIEARIRSPKTGRRMTFEELLESVCRAIPQGQYFSVVDSRDVRLDIQRAFQEVGVMMAQLEVGGTTTDY